MILDDAYLNRLLVNNFPSLKEQYFDTVSWQDGDDTGSHVVYGGVLTPYLTECIINNDTSEILKIFAFLEELLLKNDEFVNGVIACSVVGYITYLLLEYDHIQPLLGEESEKIFEKYRKVSNVNISIGETLNGSEPSSWRHWWRRFLIGR